MSWLTELNIAIKAVVAAGDVLAQHNDVVVESSAGKDLKLSSDKKSEQIILDILQKNTPYSIMTEEQGFIKGSEDGALRWIVDPLDGTVNYYRGLYDLSCVSIALWKEDQPILGVVYRFNSDQLICGVVGEGAFKSLSDRSFCQPIRTSSIDQLSAAVLTTGFPTYSRYDDDSLLQLVRNVQRFKKVRMLGTAAIMGCLVAQGIADAYYEDSIMIWDVAASAAIVLAAGGTMHIEYIDENRCICGLYSNETLMDEFYA